MSETEMIVVGCELPKLLEVWPAGPAQVRVLWRGGSEQEIDLEPMLRSYRFYAPLRADPILFGSVHLGEGGASIVWGDDGAIDMSAVTLERLAGASETARQAERVA